MPPSCGPPEKLRRMASNERNMTQVDLETDVLVAGGGMAGVCAAVAAARHGARVVLLQDRSRLGGKCGAGVSEVVEAQLGPARGRPGPVPVAVQHRFVEVSAGVCREQQCFPPLDGCGPRGVHGSPC